MGSYSLENVRLMTSSMKELGGMLGVANGAVKIDKSFCMQTKAVTRAEMAEYYTANSDPAAAQAYADNPQQPTDDVPLAVAQNYTAWLSKQLNAPVHLPSATEWMASATKITTEKLPDNGDIILQWSATPCEAAWQCRLHGAGGLDLRRLLRRFGLRDIPGYCRIAVRDQKGGDLKAGAVCRLLANLNAVKAKYDQSRGRLEQAEYRRTAFLSGPMPDCGYIGRGGTHC